MVLILITVKKIKLFKSNKRCFYIIKYIDRRLFSFNLHLVTKPFAEGSNISNSNGLTFVLDNWHHVFRPLSASVL